MFSRRTYQRTKITRMWSTGRAGNGHEASHQSGQAGETWRMSAVGRAIDRFPDLVTGTVT